MKKKQRTDGQIIDSSYTDAWTYPGNNTFLPLFFLRANDRFKGPVNLLVGLESGLESGLGFRFPLLLKTKDKTKL